MASCTTDCLKGKPHFIGYAHPQYALSLCEFGEPLELPRCGGWILVRSIPGTPYKDAMGCYPLFACRDWTKLHEDLKHVGSDIVSLALVTDPFSEATPAYLEQCFDLVKPFKTHFLVDLSHSLESFVHKDHRYYARKSQKMIDIEVCCQPQQYLSDWMRLYDSLIRRYHIKGINAFSHNCFKIQLNIPGMVMFLGRRDGEIVGATLVLIRDHVVYAHLSAFSDLGYRMHASYGIYWETLVWSYAQEMQYVNLAGTVGIKEDQSDGLTKFKRGWSNDQRTVYLCGRVFDRQKYDAVCRQYRVEDVDYFPAYRKGEFP